MDKQDIWEWLGPLAQRWGAEEELKAQLPVLLWSATGFAPLARALYVERGVLHLAVASHIVAAELNQLKGSLLARLHAVAPGCTVADLRFVVRSSGARLCPTDIPGPTKVELREARRQLPPGLPPRLRGVIAKAIAWAKARDAAVLGAGGWQCPHCELVLVKEKRSCPACGIERSAASG